ncbi:MAG: hypothetical protein A3A27_01440 [Candidatus Wildermuthbacteria bacterium RIFCSPLOWO2_01_FULL_47_18]|uniref:Uncharacterized protein n=2 Tax=Candidatus Wildermuthiibacteriota TaxID=1817923 RepID=A0A1G2RH36_9BACT|nr:MAG: hypothetical protein A3J68_00050 [Candidatus Wildermuthbacteria bacterium RIFCSPHIGHO2_02_FULL_48_16]OHA71848.1 MAG: hypothetical protein A3A27_01440 [Candidatus Wildermuthbacteria bacterium RIFCSPLOWO2_01_FULL_47_18]
MELSQKAKRLIEQYKIWYQSLEPKEAQGTIGVDEVASKVASFYEKIRGVVDWREEHLLRKTAIDRIFRRRILLAEHTGEMAEPFLQELIRGGHFPNNRIPTQKIEEVQRIINKLAAIMENSKHYVEGNQQGRLENWLLALGSCEIEELLAPPTREKALIDWMAEDMKERVQVRRKDTDRITEEDRVFLIYVGVHRSLYKLDDPTIALHLLERFYPNWKSVDSSALVSIAQTIQGTKERIENLLKHPLGEKFYQIIENYDTPYLLVGDILTKDPTGFENIVAVSGSFETAIREAYNKRLIKLKKRMRKAAFFSTLSVFLSKVLIALALEVPFDQYLNHGVNYSAIGWSISVPPLFLLALVMSVKSSSEENLQRMLLEVTKITLENERKSIKEVSLPKKRKGFLAFLVVMVYLLTFVVTFGGLAWVLNKAGFSFLSMVVFLLFLSLVSYGGTRIRHRSRELMVGEQSQGFLFGIFDFFFLPVIQTGKWFSGQLVRYNILSILLNVLIEAPFQVFIEFLEQLRTFWKEKREEIH